jgi:preprotein translocase subunit SecA
MIGDLLKKIFGDKSTKDQKLYQPYVNETIQKSIDIEKLSDDELRGKTFSFQERISLAIQAQEAEVTALNEKAANLDTPIEEKETIFDAIDVLSKEIDETIEKELLEILPEAFAVVK